MSTDWKPHSPDTYHQETARLVHFCSKTVNSNASLTGIRLGPEAALDAPYISLRTLLADEIAVQLDYAEGGASKAGIIKQMNQIARNAPEAQNASEAERAAVAAGMATARATAYSTGTAYVDHRLRQVLIPKDDAPGGYVSMTPITSGSVCAVLFDSEHGAVTLHNERVKAEPDGPRRRLRQAQFGIGGSNPQNIGSLVRVMQRPLFVSAPPASGSLREAFALYHKGIELSVHTAGPFREAVLQYVAFRTRVLDAAAPGITMTGRQEEARLMTVLGRTVLDQAESARSRLHDHADTLPRETLLDDLVPPRYALASSRMGPVMRGLLDPACRAQCDNWPRRMARHVIACMVQANDKGVRLLTLDTSARASLETLLEDVFQ